MENGNDNKTIECNIKMKKKKKVLEAIYHDDGKTCLKAFKGLN